MTKSQANAPLLVDRRRRGRRSRFEIARVLSACERQQKNGSSQRGTAKQQAVPRASLRYWSVRKAGVDADPELVAFFESPVGVAFLHQLVIAAHVVFTLVGPCGVRLVALFLKQAGLGPFVATSLWAQQAVGKAINHEIANFDAEQRKALAAQMTPKKIAVCLDETFLKLVCLVGIEPVSNFILVERFAQRRDAATWREAMNEAMEDLPVQVDQSTSDEGRAILTYVYGELGVQHNPDLFHIQQDVRRATCGPLAAAVQSARAALARARQAKREQDEALRTWLVEPRGPGRPPDFDTRIAEARRVEVECEERLEAARCRQGRAREAILALGRAYHPVELGTGKRQGASKVAKELERHFDEVEAVAREAQLSEHCHKGIAKARRLLPAMVSTLKFFDDQVRLRIRSLNLSPEGRRQVAQRLVPAAYLDRLADRANNRAEREQLRETATRLRSEAYESLSSNGEKERLQSAGMVDVIRECAEIFQRSSSCVEGRNERLALHERALGPLGPDKLKALTAVHNYFTTRHDGTTAAERFFGAKHPDLLDWLVGRLDAPPRPAKSRRSNSPELLAA